MFNEITLRYVNGGSIEVIADGSKLVTIHDKEALMRVVKALMGQNTNSFFGLW